MARHDPRWETYRSFLAVMTEGSLSAAARALGLTQPTLGRHIDELEEALGQALFTRSQAGLIATQAARELLPHAQAMASAADALIRTASGTEREERGTVRVTASVFIGSEVMPELLTRFREKHPAIAVELILSDVSAGSAAARGRHCSTHGATEAGSAGGQEDRNDDARVVWSPRLS